MTTRYELLKAYAATRTTEQETPPLTAPHTTDAGYEDERWTRDASSAEKVEEALRKSGFDFAADVLADMRRQRDEAQAGWNEACETAKERRDAYYLESVRAYAADGEVERLTRERDEAQASRDSYLKYTQPAVLRRAEAAERELDRYKADPRLTQGDDAPCYICKEPCDNYAANPFKWAIPLMGDIPGKVEWHHIGCVSERINERDRYKALAEGERERAAKLADEWWMSTPGFCEHLAYAIRDLPAPSLPEEPGDG